jgi:CheY-like chemotaxis protein
MTPHQILLAEDGLLHQKLLVSLLSKQGYEVTVAQNGQEAVESVATREFDVVLMDVEMPVMDGLTATRLIRELESPSSERLPIIGVTSGVDYDTCLAAGMDAFLEKPVEPELLHATLKRVLREG